MLQVIDYLGTGCIWFTGLPNQFTALYLGVGGFYYDICFQQRYNTDSRLQNCDSYNCFSLIQFAVVPVYTV